MVTLGIKEKLVTGRMRGLLASWINQSLVTNPSLWKVNALGNGLRDTEDGVIFPGQCQSKERKRRKGSGLSLSKKP